MKDLGVELLNKTLASQETLCFQQLPSEVRIEFLQSSYVASCFGGFSFSILP